MFLRLVQDPYRWKYGIRGGSATFISICICICVFLSSFTFCFVFFVLILIFICILIFHSVFISIFICVCIFVLPAFAFQSAFHVYQHFQLRFRFCLHLHFAFNSYFFCDVKIKTEGQTPLYFNFLFRFFHHSLAFHVTFTFLLACFMLNFVDRCRQMAMVIAIDDHTAGVTSG